MDLDTETISVPLLKTLSGEFDLDSIRFINLSGLNVKKLDSLSDCSCLEKVDLSKNSITDLKTLAQLKQLWYINISANSVTCLDPLAELENLRVLNVAGNLIGSFDSLQCLTKLQSLENLRLQDPVREYINPICHNAFYRRTVLAMLPNLKTLDGERVTGRGSDVFRLLHDLEKDFTGNNVPNGDCFVPTSQRWVSSEFWSVSDSSKKDSDQAEEHLKELLQECNDLNSAASRHL